MLFRSEGRHAQERSALRIAGLGDPLVRRVPDANARIESVHLHFAELRVLREGLRMVEQGGVKIDGGVVSDKGLKVQPGQFVLQVGKITSGTFASAAQQSATIDASDPLPSVTSVTGCWLTSVPFELLRSVRTTSPEGATVNRA